MVGNALWAFALVAGVGEALWRIQPPELLPWRTALLALAVAWLTVANLSPLNTSFPNTIMWLWAGIVWRPRVARETLASGLLGWALHHVLTATAVGSLGLRRGSLARS